tara:strand:+ start:255 stop:599 length:345 start_codon:yes stop_codon:yes gene_type:complete
MLKYFTIEEFNCTHTGKNEMDNDFLEKLDLLRSACGFSFTVSSGYRDITHPNEIKKEVGGTHTNGIAADIRVRGGVQRKRIIEEALRLGFTGIGVAKTFVHVDTRRTVPVLWVY